MSVSIILEELNMEQTSNHVGQAMTKNQKWVLASTASGFSLENMDIMFLSFALAPKGEVDFLKQKVQML